jgi:hypothetical protein
MESDLCSVSTRILSQRWTVFSGSSSAGWRKPSSPYFGPSHRRRERLIDRGSRAKETGTSLMVSSLAFVQANLQHSIAASRILVRTVRDKGIDMALIQEPWYRENCIRGLNIPGYTLYSAGGRTGPGRASW